MAFEQNKPIKIQDVKDKLDEKINTSDISTLSEIQSSTDLTGKVASASVIKDGVLTIKDVPTARYIQFGKLVVVRFNAAIREDVYTGLPKPVDYNIVVTFRDENNGKFASFYMDSDAVIKTYLATNYTPGNIYSGAFAYIAD